MRFIPQGNYSFTLPTSIIAAGAESISEGRVYHGAIASPVVRAMRRCCYASVVVVAQGQIGHPLP